MAHWPTHRAKAAQKAYRNRFVRKRAKAARLAKASTLAKNDATP